MGGRGGEGKFFFFIFPSFPMCSHYVLFKFSSGSQYVPEVPNVFQGLLLALLSLLSLHRTKNPNSLSSKLAQTAAATPQQLKVQKKKKLSPVPDPTNVACLDVFSAAFVMSSFWVCLLDSFFSRGFRFSSSNFSLWYLSSPSATKINKKKRSGNILLSTFLLRV